MICRVCLEEVEKILSIFDDNGVENNIAAIVHQYFWFKLLPNDTISTVICVNCWTKISDFHLFYNSVQNAHCIFSAKNAKQFVSDSTINNAVEVIFNGKTELQLATNLENKDINDTNSILYEPEVYLKQISCFLEKSEQFKNNILHDVDFDANVNLSNISRKNKGLRAKIGLRNPQIPQDMVSLNKSGQPSTSRADIYKEIAEKNEMIKKYISMGCDLCAYVALDFVDLKQHFKSKHENVKCAYVICCNRKFNKYCQLAEHAGKHDNPELFKCEKCAKICSNSYNLRLHILGKHPTQQQLKYSCDQCPKKFSKMTFLTLHLPNHIPKSERTFFCNKCPSPKAFASKHLLDVHNSMRHKKPTNVCHVCAKEIRDKQCFEKHVRSHFEEIAVRIKCPRADCDHWLKDEDNLKQHMRRHNDEGKIFICEQCNKSCKNRRSLLSHVKYWHDNAIYTCDECQKTFKKAISLREHKAQHSGEQLYQCPFCTRTFKSNANMHSHKKKMHPVEWNLWRKTKRGSAQQLLKQQNVSGF